MSGSQATCPMIVGLDIGGANLKAATTAGQARSLPWALWREPERLVDQLRGLLGSLPTVSQVAVTMTAELCDCFPDKAAGVRHIVQAVCQIVPESQVAVWTVDDRFACPQEVLRQPLLAAAANWRALACWLASQLGHIFTEPANPESRPLTLRQPVLAPCKEPHGPISARWYLLLDIGSTTTDLIPISANGPATPSRTDWERLQRGELLYLGARRTPLCALLSELALGESVVHLATEWFATVYDALLLLGLVPERPDCCATADGRPATVAAARQRLARMLCADVQELPQSNLLALAQAAWSEWQKRFLRVWQSLLERFCGPPDGVVFAGEGEWLAQCCLTKVGYSGPIVSLARRLGAAVSQAACAYAVACLLAQAR